jgi:hypothetical protein
MNGERPSSVQPTPYTRRALLLGIDVYLPASSVQSKGRRESDIYRSETELCSRKARRDGSSRRKSATNSSEPHECEISSEPLGKNAQRNVLSLRGRPCWTQPPIRRVARNALTAGRFKSLGIRFSKTATATRELGKPRSGGISRFVAGLRVIAPDDPGALLLQRLMSRPGLRDCVREQSFGECSVWLAAGELVKPGTGLGAEVEPNKLAASFALALPVLPDAFS